MKPKKLLSVLLTLSLLISLLTLSALPAAAAEASDYETLQAALAAGGAVVLTADVTVPAGEWLNVPAGVAVTLDLAGFAVTHEDAADDVYYPLYVKGDLTLADSAGGGAVTGIVGGVSAQQGGALTVTGGTISCTAAVEEAGGYVPSAVAVWDGSTLTIAGGTVTAPNGTGVYIVGGSAAMSGGAICACMAGVMIRGGAFTLSGGEIADNAYDGVDVGGAAFTMSGGTVSGSGEDGVFIESGSFDFSGGTISGCADEGVDIHDGAVTMSGGEITGCGTSGVVLREDSSVFTMTGGAISGSAGELAPAERWYFGGAGVELHGGSAEIAGGEIYDCVSGAEVYDGSLLFSGGTIRDAHIGAYDPEDPDIFYGGNGIDASGGTVTMTGGTVTRCEANGLFIYEDAAAAVSGGEITENADCGVSVSEDVALTLSGSPAFAGNWTDIGLGGTEGVKCIALDGPLTLSAPISVFSEYAAGTPNTPIFQLTSGLSGNAGAADFTSVMSEFLILEDDGELWFFFFPDYPDVSPDAWYAEAVGYVTFYGVFEGTDKGFEPEMKMTNAMAVQALWNCDDDPAPSDIALPFDDVASDAWYAEALRWAVSEGFVDAEQTSFRPDAPITREDLCVLCYRYAQWCGMGFAKDGLWAYALDFPDAGDVSDSALEAMSWLVMTGVINGMDGTLNPRGTATRAQTATILMRLSNVFWSQAALT